MKIIGILGDIGSGKTFIAKSFGFPVFIADLEVSKLYEKDKNVFRKLKKILPQYFYSFPIKKKQVLNAILANKNNLKKIVKIVHLEVKKKLNIFLIKNKKKKLVILDIPLLLENKLNKKNTILIFIDSKHPEILKRLKKRKNYNKSLLNKFRKLQLSLVYKKKKSNFVIKNDYSKKSVKKEIKRIIKEIFYERNCT